MKKRTKIILFSAIGLVVLLLILQKSGVIGQPEITQVAVEKSESRTIIQSVLANGKVVPELEVKISPEISGEITAVNVRVGDSVLKGQLILQINPKIILANLDRARAALNNSMAALNQSRARLGQVQASFKNTESVFKRNERLYREGVISDAEIQASKAQYDGAKEELEAAKQTVEGARFTLNSAQATLKEAQENLSKTDIYAPITGIVTQLNVEVGEKVVGTSQMAGTEMIRIANLNKMVVKVDVNENDIVHVALGDTADVEVDAYPGKKFKGVVVEIANAATQSVTNISEQVTNYPVKVLILRASYADLLKKNPLPFRPGLSGTVDIKTDEAFNQLTVPIAAVTIRAADAKGKLLTEDEARRKAQEKTEGDEEAKVEEETLKEVVFVHNKGKVEARKVTLGIQDDTYISILSGLKKGEEVVIAPLSILTKDLKDQEMVKVVDKSNLYDNFQKK
jgi:HlyD family secretion protein